MDRKLLAASSRVGLAGMLHDLGKLAERAGLDVPREKLEIHLQLYARKNEATGKTWYSHKHAAYTALALDEIEKHIPKLVGEDMSPFSGWGSRDADDSIVNAAACHHRPGSFLQWVVSTADRVASGFEREEFEKYNRAEEPKNHVTARQLTLFEQVRLEADTKQAHRFRYPLKPMSVHAMFPSPRDEVEGDDTGKARGEYAALWEAVISGLDRVPESHRSDICLWLDHFESLWGCMTQALPSATAFHTRPDVSLYDHSRAVSALSVAIWRYHHDRDDDREKARRDMSSRGDWDEQKFLLVQGDLFGIQSFIFATGGQTQKRSAKLLRGRSFYVALLTELAALKIMETLSLPPVSQIINAAGKFLIVAPNTDEVVEALKSVQRELDEWFLEHTYGESGIGLAWEPASCSDFVGNSSANPPFQGLVRRLFEKLEVAKSRRFDLCAEGAREPVFDRFLDRFKAGYGACQVDGRSPASVEISEGVWVSALAKDQVDIGGWLTRNERILVSRDSLHNRTLDLPVFGYYVSFTGSEDQSGRFASLVNEGSLCRLWDFSLPDCDDKAPLWNGYARRNLNAWIPRFSDPDGDRHPRYKGIPGEDEHGPGEPRTLNHIACDDKWQNDRGDWVGIQALMTMKGDVDNLGQVFQKGLSPLTFAKWSALSRQVNAFFTVYLPWLCQQEFPGTYTVFAGGDDFFLVGPWRQTMGLAVRMRSEFKRYVAGNPEIHFSAGLAMTKPGLPVRYLGNLAEQALEAAKTHNPETLGHPPKDAVTCFGRTVSWEVFEKLLQRGEDLEGLSGELGLSTRYLYGMLELAGMAGRVSQEPANAIWFSRFAYRTQRMLERKRALSTQEVRAYHERVARIIAGGIESHGEDFKVTLFSHLYRHRE